jgi:glycine cleavage system H protein
MECQILEVNELLDANPELVNDDPYGKGWMVKIKLSDVGMIDNLMSSDQYADFLGN